jgi:hypothetical protein
MLKTVRTLSPRVSAVPGIPYIKDYRSSHPTSCVPELKLEIPVGDVEGPAVVVQPHRALPVRRLSERVVHESPAQHLSLTALFLSMYR